MPRPIVRQPDRRIISNILLDGWLLDEIKALDSPLCTKITKSKLLKIIKFLKVSYKHGIKFIISDADHLILAEISKADYLKVERTMRTRFTTNNKNVVILVKSLKLRFHSKQEIFNKFGILLKSNEQLQKFCVVEILEFDFFNRDEVIDNRTLPWIYNDKNYNVYEDEIIGDEIDPFPIYDTNL